MEATKLVLFYAAVIATCMCVKQALLLIYGKQHAAKIWVTMLLVALFMWLTGSARAECRQFFVKRQAVVIQQVVAPYYQPQVFYAAGQDLQAEALAERVAALVERKLALRQEQALPPPPQAGAFAKCIACHSPANPAGGLVLDGSPIDCHTYFRWGEIAGAERNIPAKMQALVGSMTPEQKGAINQALLDLVSSARKEPEPGVLE